MSTATLDAPAAPSRRLSPLTGLRNSLTLTWRSVLKIRTNSEDLIGLSLQPIMFLLLFTYVFGGAIAHGNVTAYLDYVLPGILVQTVVPGSLRGSERTRVDRRHQGRARSRVRQRAARSGSGG